MLRFLLRRLPRFGFVTLFAAMLLFVSGAGWLKFHYDFYAEEERLLTDLANAGCQVFVRRQSEPHGRSRAGEWLLAYVPMFDRIVTLGVSYPTPAARRIAERGASLPWLRDISLGPISIPYIVPSPETEGNFCQFDGFVPALRAVPLPELSEPVAEGEALDEAEASRLLAEWRRAWSVPVRPAPFGVVLIRCTDSSGNHFWTTLDAHTSDATLDSMSHRVIVGNRQGGFTVESDADGRRLVHQSFDAELARIRRQSMRDYSRFWAGRAVLQGAVNEVSRTNEIALASSTEGRVEGLLAVSATRVQRMPGGLVRVDLSPIVLDYAGDKIRDEIALTLLLRPDRDFAVEAFDMTVARGAPAGESPQVESEYAFRGVASDHDGSYALDAFTCSLPDCKNGAQTGFSPVLVKSEYALRLGYDFGRVPPAEVFRAESYGVAPFPPPRPLPFWRWYRVTLAISLALFAFVAIRRAAFCLRRRRSAEPVADDDSKEPSGVDASSTARSETDRAVAGLKGRSLLSFRCMAVCSASSFAGCRGSAS